MGAGAGEGVETGGEVVHGVVGGVLVAAGEEGVEEGGGVGDED
jgi:hypothetical protein